MSGKRPWTQLERILERLPRHSHYRAEVDNDDDFAAMVDVDGPTRSPTVPLVDYDHVAMRLDNVFDAVCAVQETLVAVHSRKKHQGQPNRAPRPETALQRKRRQATEDKLTNLEMWMTGGR